MSDHRPSFDVVYMDMARTLARRSSCERLQVGCIIVTADMQRVLSCGYNGGAKGQDNGCASLEPGQCLHVHAEMNAILNCTPDQRVRKIVYSTHLPCPVCAKLVVNLGSVDRVCFGGAYRDIRAIDILQRSGIYVHAMQDTL